MVNLLEAIKAKEVAQLAEAETKFRKLAVEVATGAVVDTDEIVCRLSDAGKTTDQLAAAMAVYQQRLNHRADIDAAADAETLIVSHREATAKSDAAWSVIWDQRQNEINRLQFETQRLAGIISSGNDARRAMDGSVGPHVAAMQVELKQKMQVVDAELQELARQEKHQVTAYEESVFLKGEGKLEQAAIAGIPGMLERLEARRAEMAAKQAEAAALNARYKQVLDVDCIDPINF
jgi:hypothetical protein